MVLLQRWTDPDFAWQPFRPGVGIHRLLGDGSRGAAVAMLKYEPGASIPRHEHRGIETILVLEGSQFDEAGSYGVGSVRTNPVGTNHDVHSPEGCVVLIVWEEPVVFIEP
jgi:anti-sigma factor ChrR (cupin superfamily)